MSARIPVLFLAAVMLCACSGVARNSSEAAWRRGQCEQINDEKPREKCLERVESEFGRW